MSLFRNNSWPSETCLTQHFSIINIWFTLGGKANLRRCFSLMHDFVFFDGSVLFFSSLTQFLYWLNIWMLEGPCRVIEMICNPFSENASLLIWKIQYILKILSQQNSLIMKLLTNLIFCFLMILYTCLLDHVKMDNFCCISKITKFSRFLETWIYFLLVYLCMMETYTPDLSPKSQHWTIFCICKT